jgi:hypothetical protein
MSTELADYWQGFKVRVESDLRLVTQRPEPTLAAGALERIESEVWQQRKLLKQKREHDGCYAFDGNLDRLCVCGHTLGVHSAGSPADCLLYSFPDGAVELKGQQLPIDCGCKRFRLSRKQIQIKGQGDGRTTHHCNLRLVHGAIRRWLRTARLRSNHHNTSSDERVKLMPDPLTVTALIIFIYQCYRRLSVNPRCNN